MLFPPPVGPDQPEHLPFPHGEGDVPERLPASVSSVGEGEAADLEERRLPDPGPRRSSTGDVPSPASERPAFGKLHGKAQELVDPPHGGVPALEEVDHPPHRHRREGEHREVRVEGDESSEGELALGDGPPPEEQDEGDPRAGEQPDRPVERRGGPRDGQVVPVIPLALPGEPLLLPRLEGERLHQADPGDVLLQRRVHRGERLLDLAVPPVEGAPVLPGEVHHRGGDQQRTRR